MPTCPECGSSDVFGEPYAVFEEETGYKETGVYYFCRACGAEFTDDDLERIAAKEKTK